MTKGIFIAGAGTDVGKTYVSALLVKTLRNQGIRAGYFKPALSGAYRRDGALVPGDAEQVLAASGLQGRPEDYVAYIYEPAVSPHLAARMEGRPIDRAELLRRFHNAAGRFDYVVAEGCGGIFCPLRVDAEETLLLTDVAAMLGYDLALVSPSGLGSINAAVLAAEHAKNKGLSIRVLFLNQFDEKDPIHLDNQVQIQRFTGLPAVRVPQGAKTVDIGFLL